MQVTETVYMNPSIDSMASPLLNGNGPSPEIIEIESTTKNTIDTVYPEIPYIQILEQPAPKALRFRYECEGRSAGSIPGIHSTPENKTYPAIKIVGYKGPVVVVVSCVTKDESYRAHPHHLVGKDCKEGIYTLQIHNESMTATFSNLGIQCVKKKDIEEALKLRQEKRVDPFKQGFAHRAHPNTIDLNAVRLCFQGFLKGNGVDKYNVLKPVVTDPIYDKKAMSDLIITKLSHSSASIKGGDEVIILCEKVAKEDIQVQFYEKINGNVVWEGYGDFTPSQVHKQVAICFKTPRYKTHQYGCTEVTQKIKAFVQLKRPSDGATSEPLPFFFVPDDSGKRAFWLLRSLKPDYDILANVLADLNHPLTKQLLALQRNPEDLSDDEYSSDKFLCENVKVEKVEFENENTNISTSSSSNGSDDDEKQSNVSINEEGNKEIVEGKFEPSILTRDNEPKIEMNEFSSKEAVDNLSTVAKDKLKELGVVFSENEECDESFEGKHFKEFVHNIFKIRSPKKEHVDEDTMINDANDKNNGHFGLYTSLQMAMKNTIKIPDRKPSTSLSRTKYFENYEVMAPPRPSSVKPNLKNLPELEIETLPPLPPKRIKKNPSLNRSLPALPQKETKLALIQKLFFSKKKKSALNAREKQKDCNISCESLSECRLSTNFNADILTEAEHYALYTSVAPRATDSEFDETSCYYSPVEAEPVK